MSGHSKWASIKHKKAATDAKRGKLFSKISKEISVAAREGGKDVSTNPRLRVAINKAKSSNMPNDNIERAVKRGTGELPGITYEQCVYEGYGPGKVAIMIEALTDNKNRTTTEIRHILSKGGGNLGSSGCVGWMFHKKGVIIVSREGIKEEKILEEALEAGAEDVRTDGDIYEIMTLPQNLDKVKDGLGRRGIKSSQSDITMDPHSTVKLAEKEAQQILKLMDALEDHEDVQNVYANFDIPEEVIKKLGKE